MNQTRRRLLDAATKFLNAPAEELTIIVARGQVEIVHPEPSPLPPAQVPEGMSEYDAAILRALANKPMSAQRLARAADHRHNSYLRERLAALVEAGHVRHTRRGYARP